jgi:hypothetical protein
MYAVKYIKQFEHRIIYFIKIITTIHGLITYFRKYLQALDKQDNYFDLFV